MRHRYKVKKNSREEFIIDNFSILHIYFTFQHNRYSVLSTFRNTTLVSLAPLHRSVPPGIWSSWQRQSRVPGRSQTVAIEAVVAGWTWPYGVWCEDAWFWRRITLDVSLSRCRFWNTLLEVLGSTRLLLLLSQFHEIKQKEYYTS